MLNTLQQYLEKLARESSTPYLFAQQPRLAFRPTQDDCPDCDAALKVRVF